LANETDKNIYSGRPSVCRNCGALVGAGESACGQCDAPLATAAAANIQERNARRPIYDSETMRFARAILTRPATFTIIFLVLNICIFILETLSGGAENPGTLIAYGAKVNELINTQGEWWRFVTPIFLHGSWLHLLFNMYGLWAIGPYVEKLYGSARFVVFWVLTGIAGVVASYLSVRPDMQVSSIGRFLFKADDMPSVGASGALFGLVGVLFVFGIKFRRELPEGFKRAFGTGMLPVIMINLFIGFLGRGLIDNAAHLGGLVSGALLALVFGYKRPGQRGPVAIIWHLLQACALALLIFSFVMVWRNYNGQPPTFTRDSLQRGLRGIGNTIAAHVKAINEGEAAFVHAFNTEDMSKVDSAIRNINDAPSLDKEADALRNELKALLERVRELDSPKGKDGKPQPSAKRTQLLSDFEAWEKRNTQWVKTAGRKYGLSVDEAKPVASPSQ
jgi:rhomboid protease GluP